MHSDARRTLSPRDVNAGVQPAQREHMAGVIMSRRHTGWRALRMLGMQGIFTALEDRAAGNQFIFEARANLRAQLRAIDIPMH